MALINKQEALRIAEAHLAKLQEEIGFDLVFTVRGEDRKDGFFFGYTSRAWKEDGDLDYLLLGNAPFLVDRNSGKIRTLPVAGQP
ncbi:MAG TPA: hypothetical protein DIU07_22080 [Rhodobacteraceae bacterium]|nr:hypothetical protein [Paracoccaceae bacterium]